MLIQTQARAVREQCKLLGNWFGYVVQLTLGAIAFSALLGTFGASKGGVCRCGGMRADSGGGRVSSEEVHGQEAS
jgi:hypothetical protein